MLYHEQFKIKDIVDSFGIMKMKLQLLQFLLNDEFQW